MNKEIIEIIQIQENTEDLSNLLEKVFSEVEVDDDVEISLLIEDIQKMIDGYSPEKNYGLTPTKVYIKGTSYKLVQVIKNLRFSVEKLRSIQKIKMDETLKLVLNEPDLPEFLSDEQLMELLRYSSKSTVSSKRSRGELPQTNSVGLTAKADLFKMLRDTTPGYMTPEERVQDVIDRRNKKRKR